MNDEESIGEMRRQLDASMPDISAVVDQILSVADTLHEQIYQWQLSQGIEPEDIMATLDQLRQELDNGPDDLR